MGTQHGLGHAVTANLIEVINGALGSGQYYYIGLAYLLNVVGIVKIHPGITLQHAKVRKVGDVAQQYYGNVHTAAYGAVLLAGQFHGVLLFNMYVLEVWHYAQHRDLADILQYLPTFFKQS